MQCIIGIDLRVEYGQESRATVIKSGEAIMQRALSLENGLGWNDECSHGEEISCITFSDDFFRYN